MSGQENKSKLEKKSQEQITQTKVLNSSSDDIDNILGSLKLTIDKLQAGHFNKIIV